MKILTNITLAALTLLALNNTVSAVKIHTLSDLHEENTSPSSCWTMPLIEQPYLKKLRDEQDRDKAYIKRFPGRRRHIGGHWPVNRLSGIAHKEEKHLDIKR